MKMPLRNRIFGILKKIREWTTEHFLTVHIVIDSEYPVLRRYIHKYDRQFFIYKFNIPDNVYDLQFPRDWWTRDFCSRNYNCKGIVNGTVGVFDSRGLLTIDYPHTRYGMTAVPCFTL